MATPALASDPAANLYTLNPVTGAATLVGLIGSVGDNILIRGLAVVPYAFVMPDLGAGAQTIVVNGNFNAGEAAWNRWRAPWGSGEQWNIVNAGPTPPAGELRGGGNGSFGWYQIVPAPHNEWVRVDADWAGDIGGTGWAEVTLFSVAPGTDASTIVTRIDTGNASDIAYKKDSWGMNPPTAWGWQPASLSPHPSGNGGVVQSQGWIIIGLKLGGQPMGWVRFDHIALSPAPAKGPAPSASR